MSDGHSSNEQPMSDKIALTDWRRSSQEFRAITTDLEGITAAWEKLGVPA